MNRNSILLFNLFLIVCLLLGGCQLPALKEATAAPVSTQAGASTAEPASDGGDGKTYTNADYGISLRYPADWQTEEGTDQRQLVTLTAPDQAMIAILFVFPQASSEALDSLATQLRGEILDELTNTQVSKDEAITLADGTPAWNSVVSADTPDGMALKLSITTLVSHGRLFSLVAFSRSEDFSQSQAQAEQIAMSMHAEAASAGGLPREETLIFAGGESTNPREYDPATTHSSGDKLVFSGLVALDPNLNLIPDLAASWTVRDGTVYTFVLRPEARFHGGGSVTAEDVVYSWERAANPATESDTVLTYLGDIVGVADMRAGKAEHIAGLKVIDDHTLQVTIDAPKPYFLLKLTYPTAFVVDQANIASGVDWYRNPNGTGPYKLVEWKSMQKMVYLRNDDYYLDLPAVRNIVFELYSGTPMRLYEAGEVDTSSVAWYDVERVMDPAEPLHQDLVQRAGLCTSYLTFDVSQPPFDDPKVRQAFSMAFDRRKYIQVLLNDTALPANGLYPPGLPGYDAGVQGLPYDPEAARKLLAESKYGGAQGLPPIAYTTGSLGATADREIAAIAQMWQQNLGVTITIQNIDPDRYLDLVNAGFHGQIFDGGWCADYPDPENFADALFYTGAQQNLGSYSNLDLDQLLEQARVEQDVTRRMALYHQAEQIIIQDAPVLFTYHSMLRLLVKPYVQGYVLTPIDIAIERYLSIDPTLLP